MDGFQKNEGIGIIQVGNGVIRPIQRLVKGHLQDAVLHRKATDVFLLELLQHLRIGQPLGLQEAEQPASQEKNQHQQNQHGNDAADSFLVQWGNLLWLFHICFRLQNAT